MSKQRAEEHPLLFNRNSILCFQAGRKTQTRRVMKSKWFELSEDSGRLRYEEFDPDPGHGRVLAGSGPFDPKKPECQRHATSFCPYGLAGDRVWARETWAIRDAGRRVSVKKEAWPDGWPKHRLQYRADFPADRHFWNLRPSIFMPRWASRYTLQLSEVRVERLEDISEADALAEGILFSAEMKIASYGETVIKEVASAREAYIKLLRGKYATKDPNPWLWVLSFPRFIKKEKRRGIKN